MYLDRMLPIIMMMQHTQPPSLPPSLPSKQKRKENKGKERKGKERKNETKQVYQVHIPLQIPVFSKLPRTIAKNIKTHSFGVFVESKVEDRSPKPSLPTETLRTFPPLTPLSSTQWSPTRLIPYLGKQEREPVLLELGVGVCVVTSPLGIAPKRNHVALLAVIVACSDRIHLLDHAQGGFHEIGNDGEQAEGLTGPARNLAEPKLLVLG